MTTDDDDDDDEGDEDEDEGEEEGRFDSLTRSPTNPACVAPPGHAASHSKPRSVAEPGGDTSDRGKEDRYEQEASKSMYVEIVQAEPGELLLVVLLSKLKERH